MKALEFALLILGIVVLIPVIIVTQFLGALVFACFFGSMTAGWVVMGVLDILTILNTVWEEAPEFYDWLFGW